MSDVQELRDTGYIVRYPALEGYMCPECGFGEVYAPMQTMDMPMIVMCLRCGRHAPTGDWE